MPSDKTNYDELIDAMRTIVKHYSNYENKSSTGARQWVVEFRTSPEMEWAPNESVDRTATVIREVKPITRAQLMAAGERSSSEGNRHCPWSWRAASFPSIADRWIALLCELGIEVED